MFNKEWSRRTDQSKQVVTAGLGMDPDVSGISGLHVSVLGTEKSSVGEGGRWPGSGGP